MSRPELALKMRFRDCLSGSGGWNAPPAVSEWAELERDGLATFQKVDCASRRFPPARPSPSKEIAQHGVGIPYFLHARRGLEPCVRGM